MDINYTLDSYKDSDFFPEPIKSGKNHRNLYLSSSGLERYLCSRNPKVSKLKNIRKTFESRRNFREMRKSEMQSADKLREDKGEFERRNVLEPIKVRFSGGLKSTIDALHPYLHPHKHEIDLENDKRSSEQKAYFQTLKNRLKKGYLNDYVKRTYYKNEESYNSPLLLGGNFLTENNMGDKLPSVKDDAIKLL